MKPLLRAVGVAVLALALLNVSAGLCFCHHGQARLGAPPASGGCCHGPAASGPGVVKAASTCCHIESAESAATPVVVAHLAPPAALVSAVAAGPSSVETLPSVARVLPGASPPLFVLRI